MRVFKVCGSLVMAYIRVPPSIGHSGLGAVIASASTNGGFSRTVYIYGCYKKERLSNSQVNPIKYEDMKRATADKRKYEF